MERVAGNLDGDGWEEYRVSFFYNDHDDAAYSAAMRALDGNVAAQGVQGVQGGVGEMRTAGREYEVEQVVPSPSQYTFLLIRLIH